MKENEHARSAFTRDDDDDDDDDEDYVCCVHVSSGRNIRANDKCSCMKNK